MATNVTTYSCTCCGGCSNGCVVEFSTNYYDCTGWSDYTVGSPVCGVPDLMWVEDPGDCLLYSKFVSTNPLKCCTNTANCSTTTASAPIGPDFVPPCADSFSCDTDCCQTFTVSVVGDCYAGTYDCLYIGSCQWADVTSSVFLRAAAAFGWEVIVDGGNIPACAGLNQQNCALHFESVRGTCYCPPDGGYTLDTTLQTPPLPFDCGSASVTVTGADCP